MSSLISKITKDHESLLICEGRGSFIKACEFGFVSGFGASLDFFRPQMEGSKSLNQLRQSLNASCLFVGCVSGALAATQQNAESGCDQARRCEI